MPHGKPAGVPCVQLDEALRCRLFGKPERPAFCGSLKPGPEMCGASRDDAMAMLAALEHATLPRPPLAGAIQVATAEHGTAIPARPSTPPQRP
jgi:hypothetical protein